METTADGEKHVSICTTLVRNVYTGVISYIDPMSPQPCQSIENNQVNSIVADIKSKGQYKASVQKAMLLQFNNGLKHCAWA